MPLELARIREALAGRYAVEGELGRGGMAMVYLAEDLRHHRHVAVKVLRPELTAALGAERFLHEIELASRLEHPHILSVFDSGKADGLLYYVMPYVEGESLDMRLARDDVLPVEEAVRIAAEVADALDHAHRHGVIHRDVKPGNILLSDGHARIADFGVARAAGEAHTTRTGVALGSPAYMSPEQAEAAEVDGRTDIYGLGCVLYEMLAGEPPFVGSTPQAVLAHRLIDTPTPLSILRDSVPPALDAAVHKAMARLPADRHETAQAFREELLQAIETSDPHYRTPTPIPSKGRSGGWVAAGLTAVVAVVAIWGSTALLDRPVTTAEAGELDPNLIAVMPFRTVTTDSGVARLATQIPDLFWAKLAGWGGVRATDPPTVMAAWEEAGGSNDQPLPDSVALEIARRIGAGRLVVGTVTGTSGNLEITADLLEVPTGAPRANPTEVGPIDSLAPIVDQLVVQLVASEHADLAEWLPQLADHPPAAVREYLAGHEAADWDAKNEYFHEALKLDSTFALAAMEGYAWGEKDTVLARLAWDMQDRLGPRDRAHLRAIAGWRFGLHTDLRDQIASWSEITRSSPERALSWIEYGEKLYRQGSLVGEPNWLPRARSAIDSVIQLSYPAASADFIRRGLMLAALAGDTAEVRRYAGLWAEAAPDQVKAPPVRWLVGMVLGDSGSVASARKDLPQSTLHGHYLVLAQSLILGWELEEAEQAGRLFIERSNNTDWALAVTRNRGRHSEWRNIRDTNTEGRTLRGGRIEAGARRIADVIYFGELEDSVSLADVRHLQRVVDGDSVSPGGPADVARARCWLAQWRLRARREMAGVGEDVRYLQQHTDDYVGAEVCARLVAALAASASGDLDKLEVAELNSLVAAVPISPDEQYGDHTLIPPANMALSELWLAVGDTASALTAARRRPETDMWLMLQAAYRIDFLRREARLAALAGDRVGALRAYEKYFGLRSERPIYPPWAAQWDSVRTEFADFAESEAFLDAS